MNKLKNKNLNDFTFEEFKAMAERRPSLEGNWIYKVTVALFDADIKNPYPKFELFGKPEERLFLTYENAVGYIKNYKSGCDLDVYCSWIRQVPVGKPAREHGARWLFDKNGNLMDYSPCYSFDDDINYHFFGRSKERQRFKKGEIVETVSRDEIRLAVVGNNLPDIDWCWNIYNKCKTYELPVSLESENNVKLPYFLDYSDDCIYILDGPSHRMHDHVSPLKVMKPRFEIPVDIKEEMITWIDRAEKETDEDRDYAYSRKDKSNTVRYNDLISRFYDFNLYFKFDDNEKFLLLIEDEYGLRVSLRTNSPEYADYMDFTGRLLDSQLKALQDYLEDYDQGKPKWWYLLRKWNEDNEERRIPLDTPLPDYTALIQKKV